MTEQEERTKLYDKNLVLEQAKQIVLSSFYSYYIKRDMENAFRYISEDVTWRGTKEYMLTHGRDEMAAVLKKELELIPQNCILKVIQIEANQIDEDVFSVNGELEIRMPFKAELIYIILRFASMISCKDGKMRVHNLQTYVVGMPEEVVENENANREVYVRNKAQEDKYDALTGLYNLDYFKDTLRLYLKHTKPNSEYALLYTDIVNFEKLNNLYGMQRADTVLIQLGEMITSFSKQVVYCCRSVADHFLFLMEVENSKTINRETAKLCRNFDNVFAKQYADARLRLGVGVYQIQDKSISVDKMVENANMARKSLRVATSGRISFYDPYLYQHAAQIREIEKGMEKALENGEFKVYIQPKYNLETAQIAGAEALIRWLRPDGKMVYPDEFIPVFEKNGFIKKIDFYMLGSICQMLKRRLEAKKRCVPISVNQSRYLLKDQNYTEQIASVLTAYNTPPELVELELTERLFSDKLGDMAVMMDELKSYGIKWSIDDFGTGYSSLNLLKELPVDIIKIDKAFLDETEDSETSRLIIRKTVELTQELHKLVVCEGVETEAQAEYLRSINCDMAQGYLYAKPMPMKEFEQLLDNEKVNELA